MSNFVAAGLNCRPEAAVMTLVTGYGDILISEGHLLSDQDILCLQHP